MSLAPMLTDCVTDQTLCSPASAPFSPTILASQHGRLILGNDYRGRPYLRVVIDSHGRMPVDASLLEEYGDVLQAVAVNGVSNRRSNVVAFPSDDKKAVDMAEVMRHLGGLGCHNVLVEAGENLTGALFDLKLVDKVVAYIASDKIIGGKAALSPVGGHGSPMMEKISRLRDVRIEQLGTDLAIIGYVEYP